MSESLHPSAPHDLPGFITAPGDTDVLMVVVGIILIGAILAVGNLYLHLHTLPERMAHKSQKPQFEIVAVLGLLALFTHGPPAFSFPKVRDNEPSKPGLDKSRRRS